MTTFKIELPETIGVESRGVSVAVAVADLSLDIIARLVEHGLVQKVGDAAASALADAGFKGMNFKDLDDAGKAKVREFAKAAMDGVVESLKKGEWAERRVGGGLGLSDVDKRALVLFGDYLRANAKEVWAEHFKPLEGAERQEKLWGFFGGQDDDTRGAFTKAAGDQLAAEAKAKAGLGKLKLEVKL